MLRPLDPAVPLQTQSIPVSAGCLTCLERGHIPSRQQIVPACARPSPACSCKHCHLFLACLLAFFLSFLLRLPRGSHIRSSNSSQSGQTPNRHSNHNDPRRRSVQQHQHLLWCALPPALHCSHARLEFAPVLVPVTPVHQLALQRADLPHACDHTGKGPCVLQQ